VTISAKLVLVNEKKNSSSSASPADSCVSLSEGNLFFFIIILTTTTTYRLPNQDKPGDPKGYHCYEIYRMATNFIVAHVFSDILSLILKNVKKFVF